MKDAELDKNSCLPGDIIDQILSHLPIKEAARTSVLSSKWSNNWYTLPNLVFDKNCVSTAPSQDSTVIHNKFSRIVDHVLLLHYGPINKFEINDHYSNLIDPSQTTDIDRWILHLIRRSIKKLVLKINRFNWLQHYKIPWRLFSCQSLQHLELSCCCLKPPMTFKGFKNLKNLRLSNVKMTQDDFENLISSSPLLEKLIFLDSNTFKQIN
ncbi:F-box/FBD/LRR-repeat protein [Trifolium repens]|nr:F-box/FBD/LRR-repeat protein [Trifolium repens]